MKRFTALFTALDETNKTAEKVAAIEQYFRDAPAPDAAWGLFFLSGQRLKRVLKTSVMHAAAVQASGMPAWMLAECYEAVGDLSETVSLLLPPPTGLDFDEPLHHVVERRILPLVNSEDAAAGAVLAGSWSGMDRPQRFVFNKLVRGNFRVGVQRALVVRALAQATGLDAALLAHRVAGGIEPTPAAWQRLVSPGGASDDAARPYPFCLAHQLDVPGVPRDSVADSGAQEPPRSGGPPTNLGPRDAWHVEFKWDGIRAQVVRRDAIPGGVALWSRGEEPIADQFPEIVAAARALPPGTVLDGEIMPWRFGEGGGRPMTFAALQPRLNRKDAQPGLFDAEGVVYLAFDLLEHAAIDTRDRPLRDRLALLDELLGPLPATGPGAIRRPPPAHAATWDEAAELRRVAREIHGAEGLMLKHPDSRYHVGRVAGGTAESIARDGGAGAGWWKWKVAPYSVDAVLIYAQQGSGRRAGLYTDYTFGVWDPGGRLVPFAKAYSGLDNDEIAEVDRFVRTHTTGRTGPVRTVEPRLVFEIAFEAVRESTRHRSGVAVRFPRIARWRRDKKPRDADTLNTVKALIRA